MKVQMSQAEECRFINPAIYVEPLKGNDAAEPVESCQKIFYENCGDGGEWSRGFSHLSLNDNPRILNACRSQSAVSSVSQITPSMTSVSQSKSTARFQRRAFIDEISDVSFESSQPMHR